MIKTQHLRFLVAVVDYGGVGKAAERLHLAQPSITAGLKALEETLGGALFDRSGSANKPLQLTPAGHAFYQQAIEILNKCELAVTNFGVNQQQSKRVRIGVLETLPESLIVQTLLEYKQQDSHAELELWQGSAPKLATWFNQDRLDIMWSHLGESFESGELLWKDRLVAVLAPQHTYVQHKLPLSIRDLAKLPFIYRMNCEFDAVGRSQIKAHGVKLKVKIRAMQDSLAFQLVRENQGVTLAPELLIPSDLVPVKVTDLNLSRSIGLQWKEYIAKPTIETLSQIIRQALPESVSK